MRAPVLASANAISASTSTYETPNLERETSSSTPSVVHPWLSHSEVLCSEATVPHTALYAAPHLYRVGYIEICNLQQNWSLADRCHLCTVLNFLEQPLQRRDQLSTEQLAITIGHYQSYLNALFQLLQKGAHYDNTDPRSLSSMLASMYRWFSWKDQLFFADFHKAFHSLLTQSDPEHFQSFASAGETFLPVAIRFHRLTASNPNAPALGPLFFSNFLVQYTCCHSEQARDKMLKVFQYLRDTNFLNFNLQPTDLPTAGQFINLLCAAAANIFEHLQKIRTIESAALASLSFTKLHQLLSYFLDIHFLRLFNIFTERHCLDELLDSLFKYRDLNTLSRICEILEGYPAVFFNPQKYKMLFSFKKQDLLSFRTRLEATINIFSQYEEVRLWIFSLDKQSLSLQQLPQEENAADLLGIMEQVRTTLIDLVTKQPKDLYTNVLVVMQKACTLPWKHLNLRPYFLQKVMALVIDLLSYGNTRFHEELGLRADVLAKAFWLKDHNFIDRAFLGKLLDYLQKETEQSIKMLTRVVPFILKKALSIMSPANSDETEQRAASIALASKWLMICFKRFEGLWATTPAMSAEHVQKEVFLLTQYLQKNQQGYRIDWESIESCLNAIAMLDTAELLYAIAQKLIDLRCDLQIFDKLCTFSQTQLDQLSTALQAISPGLEAQRLVEKEIGQLLLPMPAAFPAVFISSAAAAMPTPALSSASPYSAADLTTESAANLVQTKGRLFGAVQEKSSEALSPNEEEGQPTALKKKVCTR